MPTSVKYCEKCNQVTVHYDGECLVCKAKEQAKRDMPQAFLDGGNCHVCDTATE